MKDTNFNFMFIDTYLLFIIPGILNFLYCISKIAYQTFVYL